MIFFIGALVAGGLGVFVVAESAGWRWGGIVSVASGGGLLLLFGRSDRFATVLAFLHDPLGYFFSGPDPTIVGTDYRRVAGVHPGPGVLGVMLLIAALLMVFVLLVP